jgi:hypothetical protein
MRSWTRATTHAKTVADQFGLTKWQLRMVAQGLVARPDYYAGVAAANGDKRKLDRICEEAKEAAAASSRANIGTALHAFTERYDAGDPLEVPDMWVKDYEAYITAMADAHITVHPDWIERLTVVPEVDVAGTFDRIVTMPDGRLLIADLKTGADLSYSWNEIGIQLALYSRGVGLWNGTPPKINIDHGTDAYDPMPTVDQTEALVMHLPVGEARCTLHLVDLEVGWEMALTCHQVREWRKRKDTHRPFTDAPLTKQIPGVTRTDWILARGRIIKRNDPAYRMVKELWPQVVPIKPPWDDGHIDALDRVLTHVEATFSIPFPDPDPGQPPPGADRFRAMTT